MKNKMFNCLIALGLMALLTLQTPTSLNAQLAPNRGVDDLREHIFY